MEADEIAQLVEELDLRLERLQALYNQFFQGIEKIPPNVPQKDFDRRIWTLRREKIRNTAIRFKFQQITQRYNTMQAYWMRIMREIENGTFKRHVDRAKKRFGDDAMNPGEAMRARTTEDSVSIDAREINADDLDLASSGGYSLLDSIDIEVEVDNDSLRPPAAARASAPVSPRIPPPHPLPREATANADAGSKAMAAAPSTPARPQSAVAPPPRASVDGDGRPRAPAFPRPSNQRFAAVTSAQAPPRAPLASKGDDLDGFLDAALGGERTPPSAPVPRGDERPAPAVSQPRFPAQRPVNVGTPGVGARPPPAHSQPRLGAVSAGTSSAAIAAQRPAPIPSLPRMGAVQAPSGSNSSGSGDEFRQVYARYVEAKRNNGESTANLTYESLAKNLRDTTDKLRSKSGGKAIDFEVATKDGKTVLKPVVK